jgi:hypothetical protein
VATLNWSDIPSLENAEVDWDYEPENPLGKRSCVRIGNKHLYLCLNEKDVPVKIISRNFIETGNLLDISEAGLAVLLGDTEMKEGYHTKISLQLGTKKVISKVVVRNICSVDDKNRLGLEFVDPATDHSEFIRNLVASRAYSF